MKEGREEQERKREIASHIASRSSKLYRNMGPNLVVTQLVCMLLHKCFNIPP